MTAQQRADLFVGELPDHIRMDVELQGPQDLQSAMYYARAFERHAVAIQQESPYRTSIPQHSARLRRPLPALACHAPGVSARQRAELFVGGLPTHIRADVELRGPHDLQSTMYYARAFERRAVAIQQESPSQTAGSLPRPNPAQGRPVQASAAPLAATAGRPFRRLTPAEILERRRQGLCFNCDEPYTPGHACPRLFYLEVADYIPEGLTPAEILERRRQGLCFNCDEPYTPGHACPRLFYLEVADYIPEDAVAADLAAPDVEKVFDAG